MRVVTTYARKSDMGVEIEAQEKTQTERDAAALAFDLRRRANAIAKRVGSCARDGRRWSASLGVVVTLFANVARTDDARIEGSYVNRSRSEAPIKAAIERAIAPLNFIARPIARHRLRNSNPVPLKVGFVRDGSTLAIRLGNSKPIVVVAGGARVRWEREDEVLDVGARWEGGTLVRSFVSKDGERVDRYSLSPDGNTLSLAVMLTSPLLPRAVEYRIEFERELLQ